MPGNVGRLVRSGAQGVCSVLFLVFGGFILLTGVVLTASSLPLGNDDKYTDTVGIVGLAVLGVGAVLTVIGLWLCCTLCCRGGHQGTIIQTSAGDQSAQARRRRGNSAATTNASSSQPSSTPVGYLPPNPGTRPTSGGYLPMNPQQGYQLGVGAVPQYPLLPSTAAGPMSYPAPVTSVAGQPMYTAPYPQPYPPASIGQYPAPYPGQPYYPAAVAAAPAPAPAGPAASTAENLPYNPHFMSVTSSSQSSAPPSAPPPPDDARPPSYNEAMAIHKV